VIGAGAAGIRAALAASEAGADVLMMTKGTLGHSGSTFSSISRGWGIQALVGDERKDETLDIFYNDIMEVGLGKCNPKLVRILVEESGSRLQDLLSYGIRFKKDSQGNDIRVKGCFSDYERAFITEDVDNVRRSFTSILRRSSVKIITANVIDLIVVGNTCWGAWAVDRTGNIIKINAKSTILATGGFAGIFPDNLVGDDQTGDGYALAHRAGAELGNMEFIQFMLGIKSGSTCRFLGISELSRQGVLKDSNNNDLLEKYIPEPALRFETIRNRQEHFPFSCRDSSCLIDLAVAHELKAGRKVFWKGNDSSDKDAEVAHFAHASNGGITIDVEGRSTLDGLFATGEIAAGPHGADRIGGCMMTATQVFGMRAGRSAALRSHRLRIIPEAKKIPDCLQKLNPSASGKEAVKILTTDAKKSINEHLMVMRDKKGLSACIDTIKSFQQEFDLIDQMDTEDLEAYLELRSILLAGKMIAEYALKNPNCQGSHFRSDPKGHICVTSLKDII
ncbi:MAG: FAD-binding protein, partial [Deltaproteobacteria bacterium]|nr:FAD-binding protein [Deltaproteobacteria bacterium]